VVTTINMMISKKYKNSRQGAALLVVLFIVMVITVLSLGFLSRSDVELACGRNMALRAEMDYLAESGLEHARGLILNPQDISAEYWTGDAAQQLVAGDDYYDLEVVRDDSDPTNRCNYIINCNSYRLRSGEKIGRSTISAELRLDPCIAFWTIGDTIISSKTTINGEVYCKGNLSHNGYIDGDVFADNLSGSGIKTGQLYNTIQAVGVTSPGLVISDFALNPVPDPNSDGDVEISVDGEIIGALVVNGNLTINGGSLVRVKAIKNSPALLVSGDIQIDASSKLEIEGLSQVGGGISVESGSEIKILGALFMVGSSGISGSGVINITTAPSIAAIQKPGSVPENWSPAAGAFFKSIERK
jgi:cytoskeletal protein CcmA (bactofilin family)